MLLPLEFEANTMSKHGLSSLRFIGRILLAMMLLGLWTSSPLIAKEQRQTKNVILVTIDGMRWQEIFNGADPQLLESRDGGVRDKPGIRKEFWRESSQDRRKALMPFLWTTIADKGQIFGDPSVSSPVRVTNGMKFSYPGYNEMLCGHPDPRINSNDKIPNPNTNVLEWLNGLPEYRGRVGAYGAWDRLPYILNVQRSHLPAHAGWDPIDDQPLTAAEQEINGLLPQLPRIWDDDTFDVIAGRGAVQYILKHHPRVFYLMFGETDEWAHLRRYDCYLQAAKKNDQFIAQLWETLQKIPQYAGKTSIVITTDHGRGATSRDWTDHGRNTDGAEYVWMAVLGPDTPPLGVRKNAPAMQSQVAATFARLLGEDFNSSSPEIAPALPGVIGDGKP